jgi:hypothetical protein
MRYHSAALLVLTMLLSAVPASGAVIALTCRLQIGIGKPPTDKTVNVDVTASTVNDTPATITDEVFTWFENGTEPSAWGDLPVRRQYTIERSTGAGLLQVFPKGSIDSSAAYSGQCEGATQKNP